MWFVDSWQWSVRVGKSCAFALKKENEVWPNVNKTTSIIILCLEAYRDQEPSPDRTSGSESGSESSHSGSQSASSSGSSSSEEDSRAGSAHGNAAPPAEVPQSTNRTSALCLRNISLRSGGRYEVIYGFTRKANCMLSFVQSYKVYYLLNLINFTFWYLNFALWLVLFCSSVNIHLWSSPVWWIIVKYHNIFRIVLIKWANLSSLVL